MASAKQREKPKEVEPQHNSTLHALIGEQIVHGLGVPNDLLKVQVRPLWQDRYRVNVLVGADAANARIAASFFVVTDNEGVVTACNPKLTTKYKPATEVRKPI